MSTLQYFTIYLHRNGNMVSRSERELLSAVTDGDVIWNPFHIPHARKISE
jgi:hypothetical protein